MLLNSLPKVPISPGLTLLLLQIEEMISLDFRLFTDQEYDALARAISAFPPALEELGAKGPIADRDQSNTRYHLLKELPPICVSIPELCRKAKFLRLKESMSGGANVEVNQDKAQVRVFLEKLGFTQTLIAALEEAERSYLDASNPFQFKVTMGLLRSFLENLHLEACSIVNARRGGVLPTSWGKAVKYLVDEQVLTNKEEAFVTSLYTLVSDTGVHPLVAEREYTRLMRNINIEYGLLFLARLDRWKAAP
jgi:hypothetical protein